MEFDTHTMIAIGSLAANLGMMFFQSKTNEKILELKMWMIRNFHAKDDAPDI